MNSKIILCKDIKMDRRYINVLSYSETDMISLCSSSTHKIAEKLDCSFIRKRGTIQAEFTYAQGLQSNYIAFQNPDYSNKWFFAWVDDIEYINENSIEISYTIDSWSTWFDYWAKKPCFVNRQHVNDDTIGANTISENLDVGDVVCESVQEDISLSEYNWVVVETAWQPKDGSTGAEILDSSKGEQFSGISLYNKNVFGTKLFLFNLSTPSSCVRNLGSFLQRTNSDGHISDVNNIFIVPDALIDQTSLISHTAYVIEEDADHSFTFYELPENNSIAEFTTTITKQTSFYDYTPKNNKLFTFPYNYLFVTNNIGNNNIYKYEDFYGQQNCTFKTKLSISIGCSGKLVPQSYKLKPEDYDDSLPLAKYPTCSWSVDSFTNWLTQNAVNQATSTAFGIFGAGEQYASSQSKKSIGMSAEVNLGLNIASQIANQIGNFYTGALMPNIQGGQPTGDINWASNKNTFTFYNMRAKTENLRIIDDYFSRFGYAIKRVLSPNITGRQNWNYVEIGQSEEIGYGSVPTRYMDEINSACRQGVTIWHNHENLGNYSLSNNIV